MASDSFSLFSQIIVAGGGLSLVIYQIFKHLSAKWLDNRFEKNFQHLIHEQNKELEKLKADLTKSFDKATKLHQREFEILPDVWSKLNDAYWSIQSLVSPIQIHPDLDRMEPDQLTEFIAKSELADWKKDQLSLSSQKTIFYRESIYWHRLNDAKISLGGARISLSNNGIFIRSEIKDKMKNLLDLMSNAIIEDEINRSLSARTQQHEDTDKLKKTGETLRHEIEQEIQKRLWSSD